MADRDRRDLAGPVIDAAVGLAASLTGSWMAPGTSLAVNLRPLPALEIGVRGTAFSLDLGTPTSQLRAMKVFGGVEFTQVRAMGEVNIGVFPFEHAEAGWHAAAGMRVGGLVVHRARGLMGDEEWAPVGEESLVPGWTAGAVGEVSRGHLGGRLVLASVAWVEDEGFRPNVLTPAIEVFARW